MDYTTKFNELKLQFQTDGNDIHFANSGIACRFFSFLSDSTFELMHDNQPDNESGSAFFTSPDHTYAENIAFTYPVFTPNGLEKNYDRAILLLHGLNERSWQKYLPWAYYLAQKTKVPVVLFPIAFHVNRSPAAWSDPRALMGYLPERKNLSGQEIMSTLANLALSNRLSQKPLRFLSSGKQSAEDVVKLVSGIAQGNHPLFVKGAKVDVFAYSIGAFLSQILFIGNPLKLFTDSRLFLFCGGAFFDKMQGVSKLIMDQPAFDRLRKYYITELDGERTREPALNEYLSGSELGKSFIAMLKLSNNKDFRNDAWARLRKQMHVLALKHDTIIPASGIMEVFGRKNVEIADFPYEYRHENPFPILENGKSSAVDACFTRVFSKAASFLR